MSEFRAVDYSNDSDGYEKDGDEEDIAIDNELDEAGFSDWIDNENDG